MMVVARAFLQKKDFRSAGLIAQQVAQKNPRNAAALEVLAEIAENVHSPAAILWGRKLVKLDPGNTGALLKLAAVASRFGETFVAEQALSEVPEKERDTLAFHQTAGNAAIAAKRYGEAEAHFQAALKLAPQEEREALSLNLATLRLGMGRPDAVPEARATLEGLRKNPQFHQAAARALLVDARKNNEKDRALELALELKKSPDATLDDDLHYLEELKHNESPQFPEELKAVQAKAKGNAGAIYGVLSWMNAEGMAAQSVEWSLGFPEEIRSQIPVPLALAEAYTALGNWARLDDLVTVKKGGHWGDLEFLRLAIKTRVLEETSARKHGPEYKRTWESAIIATHGEINALSMLARLVEGWGWKAEAGQVWWIVANHNAGQRPALKALFRLGMEQKNTPELYRVARRIYQVEPSNPAAANNVAMFGLLLGRDLAEANRLAEENYRKYPTQPGMVSTYALSRYLQNQPREAVDLMAKLPEEVLRQPSFAVCYGAFLAADHQADKARPFLGTAVLQKDQLLPEEAALVEKALRPHP